MNDEPWTEEPTGDAYSYMVRASTRDRASHMRPEFRFPDVGYVKAIALQDGVFAARPHLYKPGIYGYIHGWGSYHTPFSMYYAAGSLVWQVLVVRNSEVIFNRDDGDKSCRVPQAWVKFTGNQKTVLGRLRREGTPYARLVADNFEEECKAWIPIFDRAIATGGARRA